MPRRVNQVQVVRDAVERFVLQRGGLCFDGDAALAFDVHRVEHLRFHFTVRQPAAAVDQSVSKSGLAMVDVGNDGEVADVVHIRVVLLQVVEDCTVTTAKLLQRKLISLAM